MKNIRKRRNIRTQKAHEKLSKCESFVAQNEILQVVSACDDDELLCKLRDIDFIAKEVQYHNSCKKNYIARSKRLEPSKNSIAHDLATEAVRSYLDDIISENNVVLLSNLLDIYIEILADKGYPESIYKIRHLEQKLKTIYGESITIIAFAVVPPAVDSIDALATLE